ncbi:hypothetical protein BGW41_005234 [Actinomortierella wolfii]|nr:hypothetical protein BGW41_005234 [Actinomortierella wolfii]
MTKTSKKTKTTTTKSEEDPRTKDYTNVEPLVRLQPLNHLARPISTPTGGFARVRWTHAIPELNCNGCHARDALCDRFRYTCRTCGPNQFDLCKFCFRQYSIAKQQSAAGQALLGPIISRTGHVIDHDFRHELVEMDLAYPDWNDPVWHQGWGPNAGQMMTQIATNKGAWDPNAYKSGDKAVVNIFEKLTSMHPNEDLVLSVMTHIKFDGINVSKAGVKYVLERAYALEVLHVRSTPTFGGPELVSVFKEVLSDNPVMLPQLHTIYATGCNFFDFRTTDPTKARDYGKMLKDCIKSLRPSKAVLDDLLKNPIDNGLLSKAHRWNPFKNIAVKKLRKELDILDLNDDVRVIMSMCDLADNTTNPCGFPGLLPTEHYTGRDPVHCFNQTRDILLELLTYLGTPLPAGTMQTMQVSDNEMVQVRAQHDFRIGARLENLAEEKARLIEVRRRKFLERVARHAGPAGGIDKMTPEWKTEVEAVLASKIAIWSQ